MYGVTWWISRTSDQDGMTLTNIVVRPLRLIACLFVAWAALQPAGPLLAQDELGQISSRRYIVIDAETGEVFAQRDAGDQVAIASLTKVFTTVEAIELAPLTTMITTDASDLFDETSTTMGFGPGETFTLEQLIYGMLLPSGNDAAHAIARTLGAQPGDSPEAAVERFMAQMNEKLDNLGLNDTQLINPHGLGVPGHHSSARDVAVFVMYALRYPVFVDAISTAEYNANGYQLANTNKILGTIDSLIGGKTGFDEESGWCLIEVARRDGSTMIAVTLDGVAPDIWYQDNLTLLTYAFEQKAKRVAAGGQIAERVGYLDPVAAEVAQVATTSATLGIPETPVPAAAEPAVPTATPPPVHVAAENTTPFARTALGKAILGIVVLILVIAGSIFSASRRT
jgi:serine-type D-Ala-D-Ala carboxypeptidase (penicillin-binding protein 5/6)